MKLLPNPFIELNNRQIQRELKNNIVWKKLKELEELIQKSKEE